MYPPDQLDEVRPLCKALAVCTEAGLPYVHLAKLNLPDGCSPDKVDALFCPTPRDGYSSRLYFAQAISTPVARNWNGNLRLLDSTWHAFSWALTPPPNARLAQLLAMHLAGMRRAA